MVETDNGDLLQKDLYQHATSPRTAALCVTDPMAGYYQHTPPPETPKNSQVSLAYSFWGHCSFLVGSGVHKSCNQILLTDLQS